MITSQAKENFGVSFSDIPHQSALFLDYLRDPESLRKFYPGVVSDINKIADRKNEVLENYHVDRNALADALKEINEGLGCTSQTFENIERLRNNNAVAIVTGQQAGLFSGPLYTIFKAISAVKLAEKLTREGTNAVPVFWIAEEDHDFAEVNHAYVLDRENRQVKISNTPVGYQEGVPVAAVTLNENIKESIDQLFHALPHNEFTPELKELIENAYQPGVSYSGAFGRIVARVFGKYGLIVLSPMHTPLRKLAGDLIIKAGANWKAINSALVERGKALKEAGYGEQVLVEENSFPMFFFNAKGEREKVKVKDGKFSFDGAELNFDKLLDVLMAQPERFSPNALLRPVMQDYLLPTLCYFGGGAEISYFAQNSEIYRVLERPQTPIFHRASGTIVEPHVARTLARYDLTLSSFFDEADALFGKIAETFLNKETAAEFADVEEIVNTQMHRLEQSLLKIDESLGAGVAKRRQKVMHHIAALRMKFHKAQIRKDADAKRRLETALNGLYPQKALQERSTSFVSLAARHGVSLIDRICDAAEIEGKQHQVIYI